MKTTGNSKNPSLQLRLILIILLCWVMPILAFMGVIGYFISGNITKQMNDTITASVANAVKICQNRIDSAIVASQNASYIPAIRSAYTEYLNHQDKSVLFDKVNAFLSQQYKYDDKFQATILYFCGEPETLYYTYNSAGDSTYSAVKKYREQVHEQVQKLSETLDTGIMFLNVEEDIYMIRNILDPDYRPYAVIVMELNTAVMFDSIKNIVWETAATLYLGDTPVVLKGDRLAAEDWISSPAQGGTVAKGKQAVVFGVAEGPKYQLSYIVQADSSALTDELSRFFRLFVIILLVTIPLLGLVIRFFFRNISSPIKNLVKAAGEIAGGKFGTQVEGDFTSSEFQYLADSFNSMSDKLKHQFERIYREELALRDARIMALQSQINPHFLNNTLESINWEARMAGNTKVTNMIEALSTMMDAATDREGAPMIHLSQEMMYVDAYLYIISVRLGKRLTIEKEIDESMLDFTVPRLILQPIIENAVEHGIQPLQGGKITIRIYRGEDNFLVLEIENDGELSLEDEKNIAFLLSDDYNRKNDNSCNLGIRNVHQRLKIIYGEKSGLSITKSDHKTTLSKINIFVGQNDQQYITNHKSSY